MEHEGGMRDSWDWSALMHAAEKGHATCVELLAEKEGGMQESDGKTAFMNAARNGLQKQWTSLQRGREA